MTKKIQPEDCPYCASSDLISEVLTVEPVALQGVSGQRIGSYFRNRVRLSANFEWQGGAGREEKRGPWHVIKYESEELAERLDGFTVQLFGRDYLLADSRFMPEPFFFGGFPTKDARGFIYRAFFAFRAQHKASDVLIDAHWWPSHKLMVTLRGLSNDGTSAKDLQIINEILKLTRKETRGGGRIREMDVAFAIQELKDRATQKAAAEHMGVSVRALQDWMKRRGLNSWSDVKEKFRNTEVV